MAIYFGPQNGVLRFDGTQSITAVPMTFSCWMFVAKIGAAPGGRGVYLGASGNDNQYFTMGISNAFAGLANCRNTVGGLTNVTTTNLANTNAWNHVAATATTGGASSVRVVLNADFNGAGTGAGESVAGIDRFSLGVTDRATPLGYWEGGLVLVAGWNVVLPDTSIQALNSGVDPTEISPANLKYYYPLILGARDPRYIGPGLLTRTNGIARMPNPAVLRTPRLTILQRKLVGVAAAATGWGPLLGQRRNRLVA